ncbi:MAG: hypothetical protein A3I01_01530 [Betaproteobacteria bacterium RIFCSPLOWO2_02_FULL_65_24]|nr:MAG: hypothetical protein A3I01_01530 [Betaproteobacteria bacterium RIFCSPLOWO2_02_FULL_65_24]OGA85796.1 MAG: hypothetical protein A3G27_16660 [Betaproteobacteria bacterium RIFCSPLOWO2_12_FULL_66_14]
MTATKQSYAAAFVDALHDGLRSDPTVSIIGGYVLGLGPQRTLTDRLKQDFPDRVFDPPTAEAGLAAVGAGAAMAGMRPFVDLGTASFSFLAWSQITNEAAVAHYMSCGHLRAPVTYHMLHGVRGGGAAQHSQSPQAMLWNAPGLEIVAPSCAADVYGLVRTALASPNPTVMVSHAKLLGVESDVPQQRAPIPFGKADIKRRGRDVTVVANSLMAHYSLIAAEALAKEGIEVEVVDPRTLVPLDEKTILDSVARTGRLVVVDECPLRGGIASEIAATVAERGFRALKAPIARVARADVPVPYSLPLEEFVTPDPGKIATAVRRVLAY